MRDESVGAKASRERSRVGWLTAEAAQSLLRSEWSITELCGKGELLKVWCPELRVYFYPDWQFYPQGHPVPLMRELLTLLRGPEGVSVRPLTSGWEEVEWFLAPHELLEGLTPAARLRSSPASVLRAAQSDFANGAADEHW